ncbi:hypothetical protein [Nocardioides sp. Kera G14]|uniref:hypothetical protein n=1 Tax=Nocardioides sp. Kera G14 TaxID=2884264 RepID=UPI001D0F678A|nr:hypothetical protein [Nocardioides sp. Kera G14]UDY24762.1 hypothetical protein LH076_05525 [Nocardioides sp. Kera G14]
MQMTTTQARVIAAQVLWVLCSLAALVLALGAICIALQANEDNPFISAVLHVADVLDLGIFDRAHGLKTWTSENAHTKNALFNWGLGSLVWLALGWLADRFVRPAVARK